jgi:hypothetical protein
MHIGFMILIGIGCISVIVIISIAAVYLKKKNQPKLNSLNNSLTSNLCDTSSVAPGQGKVVFQYNYPYNTNSSIISTLINLAPIERTGAIGSEIQLQLDPTPGSSQWTFRGWSEVNETYADVIRFPSKFKIEKPCTILFGIWRKLY